MTDYLLLHHCCAPCSMRTVEILAERFRLLGFWFNPNIHPTEEYENREKSLIAYAEIKEIPITLGPKLSQDEWISQFNKCGKDRCTFCYEIRINETARIAKRLGIGFFSTTLLASPFQKHDTIKELGMNAAKKENLQFIYQDLREYYYSGKNAARALGLYIQKYCGCVFSKEERMRDKLLKKINE